LQRAKLCPDETKLRYLQKPKKSKKEKLKKTITTGDPCSFIKN